MSVRLRNSDLAAFTNVQVMPADWTAVIPAAGKGVRLGQRYPKALFPILNRPMLSWVVDTTSPFCSTVVVVVSPSDEAQIRAVLKNEFPNVPFDFCVQSSAHGTADAVACAQPYIKASHVLVVWADQVTVQTQTIEWCLKAHLGRKGAKLTFPTALRKSPYISIRRDGSGRILSVEQEREARIRTAFGESDCGIFLFETSGLFEVLKSCGADPRRLGQSTGEMNLLSLIPEFEGPLGACATLQICSEEETRGVNTLEDAFAAERFLENMSCHLREIRKAI